MPSFGFSSAGPVKFGFGSRTIFWPGSCAARRQGPTESGWLDWGCARNVALSAPTSAWLGTGGSDAIENSIVAWSIAFANSNCTCVGSTTRGRLPGTIFSTVVNRGEAVVGFPASSNASAQSWTVTGLPSSHCRPSGMVIESVRPSSLNDHSDAQFGSGWS